MSIESLKRWHWALIGLSLGLLIGWAQVKIGVDGMLAMGGHRTIGQIDFERGLRQAPMRAYPIIEDLCIYPDGRRFVLRMKRFEPHPTHPDDHKTYRYSQYSLVTNTPYFPATDVKKTVDVEVLPAESKVHVNLSADRGGVPSTFTGWKNGTNRWRDPGEGDGSAVQFALRPAAYQLTVMLDPSSGGKGMDELTATFNGHRLAPFGPAVGGGPLLWQTTIPRDALIDAPKQLLSLARQGRAVPVRALRLTDPTYTVLDYLKEAAPGGQVPHYRFAWWVQPRATMALWAVGAVLLLGGIWPSVLTLLTGAGFGRPVPEADYDLDRFKGEPKPVVAATPANTLTDEDQEELAALEERIMAGLSADGELPDQNIPMTPTSAPSTPRMLTAAPEKPIDEQEQPVAPTRSENHPAYQGEFYPVVRGPAEKK